MIVVNDADFLDDFVHVFITFDAFSYYMWILIVGDVIVITDYAKIVMVSIEFRAFVEYMLDRFRNETNGAERTDIVVNFVKIDSSNTRASNKTTDHRLVISREVGPSDGNLRVGYDDFDIEVHGIVVSPIGLPFGKNIRLPIWNN
jgi:hypothetical protein